MNNSPLENHRKDQLDPSAPGKVAARKKIRPTYSCLNCHKRKVKCDRVKPCGACCLRGTPSECDYGTSKRDRQYIQQATLIDNLLRSCESLKQQLAEARQLANIPATKTEEEPPASRKSLLTLEESTDRDNGDSLEEPDLAVGDAEHPYFISSTAMVLSEGSERSRCRQCHGLSPILKEKRILTDPMAAGVALEFFVERLIDNFSPANVSGTIALREAKEMRILSPILYKAFEAASLTFAGRQYQNKALEVAGHSKYINVLHLLQTALHDPQGNQSTEILLVVLLSTIIEAFKQTSVTSILRHQLGGLALLRARTPYRHRHGVERSLFVDLRLYWVTAALVHRKPTFLSSKEWLTVPWSCDGPPKDILQRLLDVAVHIPGYLAQIDEFQVALRESAIPPSELVTMQSAIWVRALELQSMLHTWKCTYADTYEGGGPSEDSSLDTSSDDLRDEGASSGGVFPVFLCRDPSTMQIAAATNLVYPDLLLATSMCYYWALNLVISATDTGLVSVLGLQERYQYACNICRSMKYYTQMVPGCLVSRIMFVLRTAFDSFPDGMVEKESMSELFAYIGRRFAFPVFSNQCTSFSVRAECE
ncbi:Zn(II)2Cys6 transcription factor domain-containing protein [Aspergillus homomorphus CBS 101889]|uniref:C6 finger domain protein n=1 Tax=Aspergillus homomorphus (strain CBS 101889) TaxID=1450537 RepID=A0A395HX27_ASPHC|nr:C6 finger domain protein [Aspergillus homomorphus CBS 101889]RAL11985.1 C6 finger domain protein [Aspergillus homomorphus CBS 101889]